MMKILMILFAILIVTSKANRKRQQQQQQHALDDPCYDRKLGKPQRCIPSFENIAYGKPVSASSTCGTPSMSYCIQNNRQSTKQCDNCDENNPLSIRDARFLTDLEELNSTCWISGHIQNPFDANLSLTISFQKKYELTYISIQFCTQLKPDSMAIYKSMDYGKTWIPFQYYSSDCKRVYNRQTRAKITQANEQEALCTDTHLTQSPFNTNRIGFSTLEGRPSFHEFDVSPVLQDWVTATDIKIVVNRIIAAHDQASPLEHNYIAISDLSIGGRCKCNGHASKCFLNKDGQMQCDCKHNTAGLECERCLPFHYDRPWARGTPRDANQCLACNCNRHSSECRFNMDVYKLNKKRSGGVCLKCAHNTYGRNCHLCKHGFYRDLSYHMTSKNACKACNCNSHTNKCKFNKELYLLSGRKSGGFCVSCKHNTHGRYCHLCRQGFYRDLNVPLTNRRACKDCNCHMIGSSSKACNQSNGQCTCKEGVTGLKCDRCKPGYQQTNSALNPCTKITTTTTTTTPSTTTTTTTTRTHHQSIMYQWNSNDNNNFDYYDDQELNACDHCKQRANKIMFKDYCKYDYVISVEIDGRNEQDAYDFDQIAKLSSTQNSDWVKYSSRIDTIYKTPSAHRHISRDDKYYDIINENVRTSKNMLQTSDTLNLWFNSKDLTCKCPKIKMNKKYLIMTSESSLFITSSPDSNDSSLNEDTIDLDNHDDSIHDDDDDYEEVDTSTNSTSSNSKAILIEHNTIIIEWKNDFVKRLKRLTRYFNMGKCM